MCIRVEEPGFKRRQRRRRRSGASRPSSAPLTVWQAAASSSKGMSLSSPIPLTRFRSPTPIHDEIQEVDEIFHNFNPGVTLDTVPGPRWKQDLHALLEQPTSSSAAFIMHVFITSLIIISALVTVFETVPTFRKISNAVWFGFETTLVALFTMEYIARSFAWSGSWRLFFRWATCVSCFPAHLAPAGSNHGNLLDVPEAFYGIIDLLAILPYYIEIALSQDTVRLFFVPLPRC